MPTPKLSKKEGEGAAGARAEIPLQPVVKSMVMQTVPPAHYGGPMWETVQLETEQHCVVTLKDQRILCLPSPFS